jgi:hypothetical protein
MRRKRDVCADPFDGNTWKAVLHAISKEDVRYLLGGYTSELVPSVMNCIHKRSATVRGGQRTLTIIKGYPTGGWGPI